MSRYLHLVPAKRFTTAFQMGASQMGRPCRYGSSAHRHCLHPQRAGAGADPGEARGKEALDIQSQGLW